MTANFDRLAAAYRWLEHLSFGRSLERARFRHLEALAGRHRVLILGEGDGRFLARFLSRFPHARAEVWDASAAMLARAASRLPPDAAGRATFRHGDAREMTPEGDAFDAIVTLFLLDCFTADEVRALVPRLAGALAPKGIWLFADFALPPAGWRRLRARLWVWFLYVAFGWMTGLRVRALPPSEAILRENGFVPEATWSGSAGLLTSAVFRRAATGSKPPAPLP